jgi:hypothetical protein
MGRKPVGKWRRRPDRSVGVHMRDVSQCEGKLTYNSPKEAARRAKGTMRRKSNMEGRLHAYRCNLCRKWHMGTISKW